MSRRRAQKGAGKPGPRALARRIFQQNPPEDRFRRLAAGIPSHWRRSQRQPQILRSCSTSARTSPRGRFSATRATTPRPTARRRASTASAPPFLTARMRAQSQHSFPAFSIRVAPASSRASANSSALNGSPCAARRPHRTSPPSSRSLARSSWLNPSTRPRTGSGSASRAQAYYSTAAAPTRR